MINLLCVALLSTSVLADAVTPGLEIAFSLERATQGISISANGRKFLSQRYSTTNSPQIVELLDDNSTVLYPDVAWNSYNASDSNSDPSLSFVDVDGARLGPDGRYWVVDGGTTGVNGSSKLVGVNLTTNSVDKLYYLEDIQGPYVGADDVRFSKDTEVAYLSDISNALMILNLTTGHGIRVLSNTTSSMPYSPIAYNGTWVPGSDGAGSFSWAGLDQIEVSPDGKYLYYQACSGGLYRIETKYLNAALHDPTLAANLEDYTTRFAFTPSTGGTTIDADGNIYVSDTQTLSIWKVTPEGYTSIILQDDRLLWTDLMWITADKKLWLPASQMRPGGDGLMAAGPNYIFTYPIDAGPSPIDHA
ncbi:hypothetical protein N7493_002208 [Penicillium malachiteum]|uniref:Major royal jelly protein n=1 Tax=Penicillium malachiteum TaxID=1324776 RepID=A0AAD6MYI8_9EURO|nr:hypothetical protein N7493_002208 [Penicillium malachiteum]